MNKLMEKQLKAVNNKNIAVLADSKFFNDKDTVHTGLPSLDMAFSGKVNGGMVTGVTIIAGESRTFKTLLGLYCMRAYLDKYPEGIAVLYDSEFGITPEYLTMQGIDANRVLHIPIEHVEMLKFDMVQRLETIERGDKVFFFVDSLGLLASKKEIDDAISEKAVADMTRAKAIRSFFRSITPKITIKNLSCVVINHIYMTMEMFAKTVVSGGSSVTLAATQIFVITKAQEKDKDKNLTGFTFTININKSRFVREKAKFPFTVDFAGGIRKYSGLLELAMENGNIIKPKQGWYQMVDTETGELLGDAVKGEAKVETDAIMGEILKNKEFQEFVFEKFKLGSIDAEADEDYNPVDDVEVADEED